MTTVISKPSELKEVNVRTARVEKLRQEFLGAVPHVCAERARIYTEGWKQTEGEPTDIRWAKVFKKWMEEMPVAIRGGELIVGSNGKHVRSAQALIEVSARDVLRNLEKKNLTTTSEVELAEITEEERQTLLECAHYWEGKSVLDVIEREERRIVGDEWSRIGNAIPGGGICRAIGASSNQFANFSRILNDGLAGIAEEARQAQRRLEFFSQGDYHKNLFYEAVIMSCEAVATLAGRYAKLARSLAENEADARRKKELEKIAVICERVPWNSARSFHEAVQSFWFIDLAGGGGACTGRIDQFFYPFYEKDVREGKLTPQEAAELLGCLYIKMTEMDHFYSMLKKQYAQAGRYNQITIGGVTREGEDATNDLSYLILEVARQTKLPQPLCVRYHKNINEDFLIRAVEANVDIGGGIPAFLNDDQAVPALVRRGIPLEEARGWSAGGCIYPFMAEGCSEAFYGMEINAAKAIEWVLYNGFDHLAGIKAGIESGEPITFASFEEFYAALKRQLDFMIERHVKGMHIQVQARNSYFSQPFRSALLDGCLEKGMDYGRGGAKYPYFNTRMSMSRGLVNLIDSVAVIKKLVFEDKKVTLPELTKAIKANWEGYEDLRRRCLDVPKFGNDDDYVDGIMRDLSAYLQKRIISYKSPWGEPIRATWQAASGYYFFGMFTGATPDGRKAREVLADAPLSPMTGRPSKGPTAVFNSAIKADHMSYGDSTMLNMKFSPTLLKSKDGMKKFLGLLRTYLDQGGYHVQLNMVNKETLLYAKVHPESYRDLVVRVAGYSAFWVELSPDVQDQIIARQEQAV